MFQQPEPAEVRFEFARLREEKGAEAAVGYLYDLGLRSGYIREEDIARNVCWTADSPYGELEITINLSKPEKDPRDIAAAAAQGAQGAQGVREAGGAPGAGDARSARAAADADGAPAPKPQCAICWENEGTEEKPQLRVAAIELGGETWGLQYSPYAYFEEHCIALSRDHRPMKVDSSCFERLLDFVDQFPFYFIGSNADLPIVGGSILSHDHFQGGRHEFPLMKASVSRGFEMRGLEKVACGVVRWPASVIRLRSSDRPQLLEAAGRVLDAWRSWSDETCSIRSHTGETPHNSLNPIVRKLGNEYVVELILRNNRTTDERPWGLFHPDESLHHIKKENIGLIEIMGLAILPPRLIREMPALQNGETPEGAAARAEVSAAFAKILETTGVFKLDEYGARAWDRFLAAVCCI